MHRHEDEDTSTRDDMKMRRCEDARIRGREDSSRLNILRASNLQGFRTSRLEDLKVLVSCQQASRLRVFKGTSPEIANTLLKIRAWTYSLIPVKGQAEISNDELNCENICVGELEPR